MRKFIKYLIEEKELKVVENKVDPRDISSLLTQADSPILMKDIKGYKGFQIAGGFFIKREMVAKILHCSPRKIAQGFNQAIMRNIPPVLINEGPVKEKIFIQKDVDLTSLPIPLMHVGDGGPYITGGIVIANDPLGEFGTNLGMYRLMYRAKNETGIDIVYASDLRTFYERALKLEKPLPISVVIGVHPALMMAATYKAPLGVSEYDIAGGLLGEPIKLVKSETNDIYVPAEAEIVLEGEILPIGWTEQEGPFGEFAGYQGEIKWNPLVKYTAITMRRDPIYYALAMPWENDYLLAAGTEASCLRAMANAGLKVHEVRSTFGGACFWQVIASIDKRAGEGKNALLAMLAIGGVKFAVVTDSDVDIFNPDEVDRAMVFRVRPEEDVMIISGARANHVDPSVAAWLLPKGKLPVTSKIGIDATKPDHIPMERYQRIRPYRHNAVNLHDYLN